MKGFILCQGLSDRAEMLCNGLTFSYILRSRGCSIETQQDRGQVATAPAVLLEPGTTSP